jgi:hypothetical protein
MHLFYYFILFTTTWLFSQSSPANDSERIAMEDEILRLTQFLQQNKNTKTEMVGKAWGNLGMLHQVMCYITPNISQCLL